MNAANGSATGSGRSGDVKQTQNEMILAYMRQHGGITQREATEHIGCTRLAARIADLKRQGINIGGEMVKVQTRDGFAVVKRYWEVRE